MTFYKLTVHRIERDPDYERKYAEWAKTNGPFNYERQGEPRRDAVSTDALEVELNADEFKALRDAVVAQWK
jgi:hypothetical protein